MDNILIYLLFTGVLALLQCRESYATLRTGERPTKIDWSFAFLEFVWLPVSIAVLYYGSLSRFEAMVPVGYIVLSLYGWLIGYLYYRNVDISEYKTIEIPTLYLVFSIVYCACLAIYAFWIFYDSLPRRNEISIADYLAQNWMAIAGIVAIIAVIKFSANRVKKFSYDTLDASISGAINRDPVCVEHLGEVTTLEMNTDITAEYEKDVFAYRVQGEKASGLLVAKFFTDENDDEHIVEGYIELTDGKVVELENKTFRA